MTSDAGPEADGPVVVDVAVEDARWAALVAPADPAETAAAAARAALAAGAAARAAGHSAPAEPVCVELAVVLADDAAVRALNRTYRGRDAPTNVLSFALTEGGGPAPPAGTPVPLGDVVLAYETVATESKTLGKPPGDHLYHLVTHGVLHLLGYDHDTPQRADAMEGLETAILARAGLADPYAESADGAPVARAPVARAAVARAAGAAPAHPPGAGPGGTDHSDPER